MKLEYNLCSIDHETVIEQHYACLELEEKYLRNYGSFEGEERDGDDKDMPMTPMVRKWDFTMSRAALVGVDIALDHKGKKWKLGLNIGSSATKGTAMPKLCTQKFGNIYLGNIHRTPYLRTP